MQPSILVDNRDRRNILESGTHTYSNDFSLITSDTGQPLITDINRSLSRSLNLWIEHVGLQLIFPQ